MHLHCYDELRANSLSNSFMFVFKYLRVGAGTAYSIKQLREAIPYARAPIQKAILKLQEYGWIDKPGYGKYQINRNGVLALRKILS